MFAPHTNATPEFVGGFLDFCVLFPTVALARGINEARIHDAAFPRHKPFTDWMTVCWCSIMLNKSLSFFGLRYLIGKTYLLGARIKD